MNFIIGLNTGVVVLILFILIAYAIIFNVIDRQFGELDRQLSKLDCQLDKLRETIQDIEDMICDKNHGEFYDDNNSEEDDEDEDLEEGDV